MIGMLLALGLIVLSLGIGATYVDHVRMRRRLPQPHDVTPH